MWQTERRHTISKGRRTRLSLDSVLNVRCGSDYFSYSRQVSKGIIKDKSYLPEPPSTGNVGENWIGIVLQERLLVDQNGQIILQWCSFLCLDCLICKTQWTKKVCGVNGSQKDECEDVGCLTLWEESTICEMYEKYSSSFVYTSRRQVTCRSVRTATAVACVHFIRNTRTTVH